MLTIYHNNRCGKSRSALCILEETGKPFKTVEYLKDVPSVEELKSIIKKLQLKPHDLIRTKEPIYLENYKGKTLSDDAWIEAMHKYPILIVPFVAAVLTLASLSLSVIGGWNAIANKYRVNNWQATEKWRYQSMKANAVEYSNCVTFGADSERIYLSVIFFLRLFHPPLGIPYADVKLMPHTNSSLVVALINGFSGKIVLPKKLAYKLVMISEGKLKINIS